MPTQKMLGTSAVPCAVGVLAPGTEEEREVVREQLERILASPPFRNSKRYASVLRYIVQRTLDGTGAQLKERTIGIEVFGRAPDYDTATDHAVRSAVAEIRKRLAQYYQEEGTRSELRIEVQPGSYVPQFRFASLNGSASHHPASRVSTISIDLEHEAPFAFRSSKPQGSRNWTRPSQIVVLSLAVAGLLAALLVFLKPEDPLESFWGPVVASRGQILLCVGNLEGGRQTANDSANPGGPLTVRDFHTLDSQTVHIDDVIALSDVAGLLQTRGKQYHIASQSEATFTDLQNGPAVLIGLMNNDWTERLVNKLRFSPERPAHGIVIIRDHHNPSSSDWSMNYATPYLEVNRDYALVLRLSDPKTEQLVVAVAGISVFGTLAAAKFLTNPDEIRQLRTVGPRGWEKKNLELVLTTEVIRGKPGRASIVAADFW